MGNPWLNKDDRERMLAGMKLAAKKNKQARNEIEHLRAALHWTAQNCLDHACVQRAMEALK